MIFLHVFLVIILFYFLGLLPTYFTMISSLAMIKSIRQTEL
jgi:hypothetical protein